MLRQLLLGSGVRPGDTRVQLPCQARARWRSVASLHARKPCARAGRLAVADRIACDHVERPARKPDDPAHSASRHPLACRLPSPWRSAWPREDSGDHEEAVSVRSIVHSSATIGTSGRTSPESSASKRRNPLLWRATTCSSAAAILAHASRSARDRAHSTVPSEPQTATTIQQARDSRRARS